MDIYLVGGAVRDQLLGFPVYDSDWVVIGATAEQMLADGFTQVGKDFPVFLHPQSSEEYALARTERKTAPGYSGFSFDASESVTLEEDLLRRDLTINAIAQDPNTEQLIDPYGGCADIEARVLRHVSPAFAEDPVRILRLARFAARFAHLGFTVAEETYELMTDMVASGEVDALVPERVWKEMSRALSEATPIAFFDVLRRCGALARIMPELDALFGVPQPEQYHPEIDTGVHALLSLEQACLVSENIEVRFAALTHDLGKACTDRNHWPSHKGHEQLGIIPIKNLCNRLGTTKDVKTLALLACEYHTHVHRALTLDAQELLKVIKACDALRRPERWQQLLLVAQSDSRGRTGLENIDYPQRLYLEQAAQAAVDVKPQALIAEGFAGAELGVQLDVRRLEVLGEFIQSHG